jgi:hypothetical protein
MKAGPCLLAALTILLICSCHSTPQGTEGSLLSARKPARASSAEDPSKSASNAVDRDPDTRWSSNFFDPQWIMVDLGEPRRITMVRLVWEKAFGREYEIQISDDAREWTRIHYTATGRGGIETIKRLDGRGRYVRYYGTARGTGFGHSLVEFEVYGQ